MKYLLTGMSALLLCGCLGRGNTDLLHARIREQQAQIADAEQKTAQSMAELQRLRREADSLRAELTKSQAGILAAEHSELVAQIARLQIHSLLSGGVNRDDTAGDDAFVAHIAPVDDDGEVVKYPGRIDLTLIDPALPETDRQIGAWQFSTEECRSKWTRGFAGSGYQFTLPIEKAFQSESLLLHAKMTTSDGRQFDANQICRVTPSRESAFGLHRPALLDKKQEMDDLNDPPPPAGDPAVEVPALTSDAPSAADRLMESGTSAPNQTANSPMELPEWVNQDVKPASVPAAPPRSRIVKKDPASRQEPLRDSTNWTDATIPVLR